MYYRSFCSQLDNICSLDFGTEFPNLNIEMLGSSWHVCMAYEYPTAQQTLLRWTISDALGVHMPPIFEIKIVVGTSGGVTVSRPWMPEALSHNAVECG